MTDFQSIQQKYYEYREEAINHFGGLIPEIEDYVNALEEREKKMIDFLCMLSEYEIDSFEIENFIKEMTGKTVDEVLKR